MPSPAGRVQEKDPERAAVCLLVVLSIAFPPATARFTSVPAWNSQAGDAWYLNCPENPVHVV